MFSASAPSDTPDHAVARDDWDEHWDAYADAAGLNPAQAFRRRLIIEALAISAPAAKVLDIGSGTGDLAVDLLRELPSPEILGVELSAKGVEISRRQAPAATFVECDLLAPDAAPAEHRGWADHAVCSEVLEHVDDPVALLRGARPLLAPGCRLVVTVPGGPMSAFDRHIGHRRHFSPDDLAEVMSQAGLEVEWVRGAGFPFFNLYRFMIIALGDRLIETARVDPAGSPPWHARAAAKVFDVLFRLNARRGRLGFQTIGAARVPTGQG